MMNVLALSLVLTTLVTAVVFSPNPEKQNSREDVIVREGHRTVVVEYDKNDHGNTKVSISPQEVEDRSGLNFKEKLPEKMEDAKERTKEASSSVLQNMGQGDSSDQHEEEAHHRFNPRELVCDAYGKCKHKIASAMGRTKEAVSTKAHEAADKVYEVEEEAKDVVGKLTDSVTHKTSEAKGYVKDTVSEKAHEAKKQVDKAKQDAKILKEEAKMNVSTAKEATKKKAKEAREMVEKAAEKVKDEAQSIKDEGEKGLKKLVRQGWGVSELAGILHLLGLATAYGMCMWMTFVSSYVLAGALSRQQFGMVQSKIYPVYFKSMAYTVGLALLGHVLSQWNLASSMKYVILGSLSLLAPLLMLLVNVSYLEPRSAKVMMERMKKEKEEGRGREGFVSEPAAQILDAYTCRVATGLDKENTERGSKVVKSSTGSAAAGRNEETSASASQDVARGRTQYAEVKRQMIRLSEILKRLNLFSSCLNILTLMSLTWQLVDVGRRLNSGC